MSKSVNRVRASLANAQHEDTIASFPDGTKTAKDAACAVGCTVAQIVKSMVFRTGETPVLILTSGVNRVDVDRAAAALGQPLEPVDGKWVRSVTGFAIGGVAPIGHLTPPIVLIDEDLLALSPLWAAAGSPLTAFRTEASALVDMTQGRVANIRKS